MKVWSHVLVTKGFVQEMGEQAALDHAKRLLHRQLELEALRRGAQLYGPPTMWWYQLGDFRKNDPAHPHYRLLNLLPESAQDNDFILVGSQRLDRIPIRIIEDVNGV